MKRMPALQPLSRDHHHALSLAQRLIRDGGDMSASLASKFSRDFIDTLEPHFSAEEILLLPELAGIGEFELVARTKQEHDQLRSLSVAVSTDPENHASAALAFANLLKEHVRFEEQTLFPCAELKLSTEVMNNIHQQLHH